MKGGDKMKKLCYITVRDYREYTRIFDFLHYNDIVFSIDLMRITVYE